jgi:NitT/TauT family transport system permease protein
VSAPALGGEAARPSARPAWRRFGIGRDGWLKVVAGLVIVAVWEVAVRLTAPAYVAKPSSVVAAFPEVMASAKFWAAAGATLGAVVNGLVIAIALGTMVGLAMGRIKLFDRLADVYISGLYAMPMVAVLPPIALWFGYTGDARLATVVFAAFFSIAINAADGARSVPPEFLEVGRSYRAGRLAVLFGITLPSAVPYLLAGIRLAAGRSLIGAVVAEYFVAIDGLGYYILFNSRTFQHARAFVAVAALAAFGVGVELLMQWLTRRYLPWYRRDEGRAG